MQRMSDAELIDIIDERYRDINLNITHFIKKQIIDLCQGMPGFAHLAGREAALSSIARKSRDVDEFDYKQSIKESVRTSQESILTHIKRRRTVQKKIFMIECYWLARSLNATSRGSFPRLLFATRCAKS